MTATKTRKIKGTVASEKYRPTRDRELWYIKLDGGKVQACFYAQGGR